MPTFAQGSSAVVVGRIGTVLASAAAPIAHTSVTTAAGACKMARGWASGWCQQQGLFAGRRTGRVRLGGALRARAVAIRARRGERGVAAPLLGLVAVLDVEDGHGGYVRLARDSTRTKKSSGARVRQLQHAAQRGRESGVASQGRERCGVCVAYACACVRVRAATGGGWSGHLRLCQRRLPDCRRAAIGKSLAHAGRDSLAQRALAARALLGLRSSTVDSQD